MMTAVDSARETQIAKQTAHFCEFDIAVRSARKNLQQRFFPSMDRKEGNKRVYLKAQSQCDEDPRDEGLTFQPGPLPAQP